MSAESPELEAVRSLCDAIGANVQLGLSVMFQMEDIAASMKGLGLMPDLADELRHVGKAVYESAKAVSAAHAQSATTQLRAQERAMGETILALLDHAGKRDAQ